ncbi:MAG: tRNA uridine-5-carboxymethylaminomethyl(34) synthesis enzyme MnmG [Nitrospirae bacterium]|nr:tRNA uridine-5-carboxymethylaminomethyl(34) synthesis enzyme MnmG [Nitrospirota bacterium]
MSAVKSYDCIVTGGGHAGTEAALAAAKMGLSTCLFTMNLDTIGQLSCNPAIGGLAKGHIVREIDSLGGVMAQAADFAGIQFRMLNRSKGPAVWSLRAQADRVLYRVYIKRVLEETKNLDIKQGTVTSLTFDKSRNRITGVVTSLGTVYHSKAVIVTTGTFLNGLIHIGLQSFSAGRAWEFPSVGLSESLSELGLKIGRLKTGTPPRLDAKTIDFNKAEPQWGDNPPVPFSFSTKAILNPQLPCYITYTNEKTHGIIHNSLDRSPLYSGKISGKGPRYCPSIEDKVVRFSERPRHQVFLEPDGLNTSEYYANGISTSLPLDVQIELVRSIAGLEGAELMRPGYAVEYDFVYPACLRHTLEVKTIEGLYLAGQINSTSGYEEAAAQGLVAGMNAALKIKGAQPLELQRHEAYIGVMIDDLVTLGITEPYRMFTSRAEYRLLLRNDNAELRLKEKGYAAGLVDENRYEQYKSKLDSFNAEMYRFKTKRVKPDEINPSLIKRGISPLTEPSTLEQLLKRPGVDYEMLESVSAPDVELPTDLKLLVEAEIKYEGYIKQQEVLVEKMKRLQNKRIPDDFNYKEIGGLSTESLMKLLEVRPETVGQAQRIPGVTPSSISMILAYLEKRKRTENQR